MKTKKIFSLITHNLRIKFTFFFLFFVFILFFLAIKTIIRDDYNLIIDLLSAFLASIIVLIIDVIINYIKYIPLEGEYKTKLYETDKLDDIGKPEFRKLKKENEGTAKLEYKGGNIISIIIEHDREPDYKWYGEAALNEYNTGTLIWWYESPEEYKNYTGYKKLIIKKTEKEAIKIYLFGEDKHIPERKVLIKKT